MSIFYCPQCGKFDKDFHYNSYAPKVINIRDGFGHPIYHIKCECGNYLAGYMNFNKTEAFQDEAYIKGIITGYNLDGIYIKNREQEWCNYVKESYDEQERRINDYNSKKRN
jgi:hypothetical protein